MKMNSCCTVLCTMLLIINESTSTSRCSRAPVITGSFGYPGTLVPVYNISWKSFSCYLGDIAQYQIQFVDVCSMTPILTTLTGSNQTTVVISLASCEMGKCHVRVRGEFTDGSLTDYSLCVLINQQLLPHKRHIEFYYQDTCVPIQGTCDDEFVPEFYINNRLTLWPLPGNRLYNTTRSPVSRLISFCFTNVSEDIVLTEYCYRDHSMGCSLCTVDSGELYFLTHVEILLLQPGYTSLDTVAPSILSTAYQYTISKQEYKSSSGHSKGISSSLTREFQNESSSVSSSEIPTTVTESQSMTTDSSLILYIGGAISLSILIGAILAAFIIGLWCHKKQTSDTSCLLIQKQSNQGNIYDDPSLPDPIYQEVSLKTESDVRMGIIGNLSYTSTRDSVTIFKECPAYVRCQDIN